MTADVTIRQDTDQYLILYDGNAAEMTSGHFFLSRG